MIALIESQVEAVLEAEDADALQKARCIGYLATVSLKAIECANYSGACWPAIRRTLRQRRHGGLSPRYSGIATNEVAIRKDARIKRSR